MDEFFGCLGMIIMVLILAAISSAFAIFGVNGLLGVMNVPYSIPWTFESFLYMWILMSCFGAGASSKK